MDRGALWATVHRVAQSRTGLKQFSIHVQFLFYECCRRESDMTEQLNNNECCELHKNYLCHHIEGIS